ncbi:hypothetical protein R3P38DRAFT_3252932 [Favolaschia claudopus]|uniref:Uncharacterized protein n=1 Tax=Favolaschia claudopus TaxID=2862362 RepID=A0AAW0E206_9AGAR
MSAAPVVVQRNFHFPPFPPVPEGVRIIPFKDFKEWGAGVTGEDGIERDGRGIPTIAMVKKAKKAAIKTQQSIKIGWWNEWKGFETPDYGPYDANLHRVERLSKAADDFSKYWSIPQYEKLQKLWQTFRGFLGINDSNGSSSATAEAELSDDEDDDHEIEQGVFDIQAHGSVPLPDSEPDTVPQQQPKDKNGGFFDNTEESMKIFFSSYLHEKGELWEEIKALSAPHLLRFFFDFLEKNNVLPECANGLKSARKVLDLAEIELARIHPISKGIPDAFSEACKAHWGSKLDNIMWDLEQPDAAVDEPATKRVKLTHATDQTDDTEKGDAPADDTQDVDMTPAENGHSSWGASGWGNDHETSEDKSNECGEAAWGQSDTSDWSTGVRAGAWGGGGWGDEKASLAPASAAKPESDPRPSLVNLLGPTSLPITHTTGIVEWSVRRVKSINAPPTQVTVGRDGAEAVERGLEARMHRLVLGPWVGAYPAAEPPHLLRDSRGAVAPAPFVSDELPRPHDVSKSDINVLVEPEVAALFLPGMGLGGTWVQLARVGDLEGGGPDKTNGAPEADAKKLTNSEKKRRMLRYWYVDSCIIVVPSYWSVSAPAS